MANITERKGKNGTSYRIRVTVGCTPEGVQKFAVMTWKPGKDLTPTQVKNALKAEVIRFENEVESGLSGNQNITFGEFSKQWLEEHAKKNLAPATVASSRIHLESIGKYLGHLKLSKIRKQHIQQFVDGLSGEVRTRKRRDEESKEYIEEYRLGAVSVRDCFRTLSTVLTRAVQLDLIKDNPCLGKAIILPKGATKDPKFLEDDEAIRFLELLENESMEYRTFFSLAIYSGCRKGELLGLDWSDIDFEHNRISITKVSQYVSGIGVFTKEPKNKTSIRIVPIDSHMMALLKQYKKWQAEQRLKMGELWKASELDTKAKYCDNWNHCTKNNSQNCCRKVNECKDFRDIDRLFTRNDGLPMHPDTPWTWLRKFTKKHNLPAMSVHELRHTYVSLHLFNQTPLSTVAKLAGHSSTTTTSKVYAHSIKSAEVMAAETIGNVLNPKKKQA